MVTTTLPELHQMVAKRHQIEGMREALNHVRGFEDRAFLSFRIKVAKRELQKQIDACLRRSSVCGGADS